MNIKKLTMQNVCFHFDNKKQLFNNVSALFFSKTINVIQGKNGVGKSTFFNIIKGNVHQENISGTLSIDSNKFDLSNEENLSTLSKKVTLVTQQVNAMLADMYTVEQNIAFAQLPTYPTCKPLSLENISALTMLNQFGIKNSTQVGLLSGGQKQLLAIAMAMQTNPEVLLLDEPTAALDETNAKIVMDFLTTIAHAGNTIIILISHDTALIEQYTNTKRFILNKEKTVVIQEI